MITLSLTSSQKLDGLSVLINQHSIGFLCQPLYLHWSDWSNQSTYKQGATS